jgi:hypothetical protein
VGLGPHPGPTCSCIASWAKISAGRGPPRGVYGALSVGAWPVLPRRGIADARSLRDVTFRSMDLLSRTRPVSQLHDNQEKGW